MDNKINCEYEIKGKIYKLNAHKKLYKIETVERKNPPKEKCDKKRN